MNSSASKLLIVVLIHFLLGGASISLTFPFSNSLFRRVFRRRNSGTKKAPSPEEQKITRLEGDLHDISVEYDIMRERLHKTKRMHGEQRSKILSLKRDAEKAKRQHEEEIQSIHERFETEKEIVVRNMQLMFEKDLEKEREHLKQEMRDQIEAEKQLLREDMGVKSRQIEERHEAEVTELKFIIKDLKSKLNEKTKECESATMEINKLKDQLRAGVLVLQQDEGRPLRANRSGRGSSSSSSSSSDSGNNSKKVGSKSKAPSSSAATRRLSIKQGGGGNNSGGTGSAPRSTPRHGR